MDGYRRTRRATIVAVIALSMALLMACSQETRDHLATASEEARQAAESAYKDALGQIDQWLTPAPEVTSAAEQQPTVEQDTNEEAVANDHVDEFSTAYLLPGLPADLVEMTVNPEIPDGGVFVDLFGDLAGRTEKFASVSRFLGHVETFGNGLTCAYENDLLAIGIYRDTEYWYSVGAVAVAREPDGWTGAANDVLDMGWCWLRRQVMAMQSGPVPQGCFHHLTPEAYGVTYHMVVIGSTDWMCDELLGRESSRDSIPEVESRPQIGLTLVPQTVIPITPPAPLVLEQD